MQSIFIDITNHLQRCSTELLGYCIVMQAKSILIDRSAAPTTGLLILFFLIDMANEALYI